MATVVEGDAGTTQPDATPVVDEPVEPARRWRPSVEQVFAIVSPLVLLVVWETLSRTGRIDDRIFSRPTEVFVDGWDLTFDGTLPGDIWATTVRFFTGFLAGVIPGTLIGLTMGLFRLPRAVFNPLVKALYPLPRVALFPLVILLIGRGEMSFTVMVAIGPFFTMIVSSMAGVMNVDPIYFKVARSFRTGVKDMYTKVVFPAALPIIFSGLRLSIGMALVGVVAVEFLLAPDGLGYLIWRSWEVLSLSQSMVGLVVVGVMGYLLYVVIDAIEKRAVPWADARNQL